MMDRSHLHRDAAWVRSIALGALASLFVAAPAGAVGLRIGDPVAVRGSPVEVRFEVLDDPGVVATLEVELRRGHGDWQLKSARREDPTSPWWRARYPRTIWTATATVIEVRAAALGRRGGRVAEIGFDQPIALDLLTPAQAQRRAEDLRRTEALLEQDEAEALVLAGLIAIQVRLNDPARLRGSVGVVFPFERTLAAVLRVTVGPGFEAPENLPAGAVALGAEVGLRWRSGPPLPGVWTSFAGPRLGAEFRFPSVDALAGVEAGVHYGLSDVMALEAVLISGMLVSGFDTEVGVEPTGGLRVGIRFGGIEP